MQLRYSKQGNHINAKTIRQVIKKLKLAKKQPNKFFYRNGVK